MGRLFTYVLWLTFLVQRLCTGKTLVHAILVSCCDGAERISILQRMSVEKVQSIKTYPKRWGGQLCKGVPDSHPLTC